MVKVWKNLNRALNSKALTRCLIVGYSIKTIKIKFHSVGEKKLWAADLHLNTGPTKICVYGRVSQALQLGEFINNLIYDSDRIEKVDAVFSGKVGAACLILTYISTLEVVGLTVLPKMRVKYLHTVGSLPQYA